jgi:Cobalamin-independent synthase, Catalytic domain
LHLCFSYAYVAPDKPNRYAFLSESAASRGEQISIEAAQPKLDLKPLGGKTLIFGVISMGDPEPETPETVAARIRAALRHPPRERLIPAPDSGMKYIPRDLAFAKLKALAEAAPLRPPRIARGLGPPITRRPTSARNITLRRAHPPRSPLSSPIAESGTNASVPSNGIHAMTVRPTKEILLEICAGRER